MSDEIRVVEAKGKLAIVRGMSALVGPLEGSIDDLENKARESLEGDDLNDALTAIDIFKSK